MDKIFEDCQDFVVVYIDDVLVFSKDNKDHEEHLKRVFKKFEDNGLIISKSKIELFKPQIQFLGVTIGNGKIELQPHIATKIKEFPEDIKDLKTIQKLLGLLNYARPFIKDLSKFTQPLYAKTKKNGVREFDDQDKDKLRIIKRKVENLPALQLPLEKQYLIIESDGSGNGWGAVLLCKDTKHSPKNTEKICRYSSGTFREKGNITAIDAEILAVRYALEAFELFLLGKENFTIRTDCVAIVKFYNNMKREKKRSSFLRWHKLTSYIIDRGLKPDVEHIKGDDNKIADILSRIGRVISINEDTFNSDMVYSEYRSFAEMSTPFGSTMRGRGRGRTTNYVRPTSYYGPHSPIRQQPIPDALILDDKEKFSDFTGTGLEFNPRERKAITKDEKILMDNIWNAFRRNDMNFMIACLNGLNTYFNIRGPPAKEIAYVLYTGPKAGVYRQWTEITSLVRDDSTKHCWKRFESLEAAVRSAVAVLKTTKFVRGPQFVKKIEKILQDEASSSTPPPATAPIPEEFNIGAMILHKLEELQKKTEQIHDHCFTLEDGIAEMGLGLTDMDSCPSTGWCDWYQAAFEMPKHPFTRDVWTHSWNAATQEQALDALAEEQGTTHTSTI